MSHPPIPPDCEFFFEKDGRWYLDDSDHHETPIDLLGLDEDARLLRLISAIAFFYWTREAQRLKRYAERELSEQRPASAMAIYTEHLAAVQAAVGWAKWSGL